MAYFFPVSSTADRTTPNEPVREYLQMCIVQVCFNLPVRPTMRGSAAVIKLVRREEAATNLEE